MSSKRVRPVENLSAEALPDRVRLTWDHTPWEPLIDHYAVYAAEKPADGSISDETLVARTVRSAFDHVAPGGPPSSWSYRVVTVDAAARRSSPTPRVSVQIDES